MNSKMKRAMPQRGVMAQALMDRQGRNKAMMGDLNGPMPGMPSQMKRAMQGKLPMANGLPKPPRVKS